MCFAVCLRVRDGVRYVRRRSSAPFFFWAPPTFGQGYHMFALDYSVKWPLSIVLSKRALTKYQLLFRHLFFCKHVERELCSAFITHQV
jgi:hypothetical protein